LANAVGGSIEGGLKARQATVNARNIAATDKAKAKFKVQSEAVGPPIAARASRLNNRDTNRTSLLRDMIPNPKDVPDWQRPPAERKAILDFERSKAAASGSHGLTYEQQVKLAELRGENPKVNYKLRVIEYKDKAKRGPLQRALESLSKYGTPEKGKDKERYDELTRKIEELDAKLAEESVAVIEQYDNEVAPGEARIVNGKLVRTK
jgi:hypothetical protein